MDKETNTSTPEEQKAEQEALVETKEEEIREKVMADLALDPDIDSELIDNLVKREISQREKFSDLIRQKIKWREKAQGENPENNQTPSDPATPPKVTDDEAKIRAILDEERLEEMNVSDEVKDEIRNLAKLKNLSVKKVVEDPYIQYRMKESEAAAKVQEAGISGTKKGIPVGDGKTVEAPQFDYTTEEGIKAAKEWRAKVAKENKE